MAPYRCHPLQQGLCYILGPMHTLKYLTAYPEPLRAQVRQLLGQNKLGEVLLQRYPEAHGIRTDKALYAYVQELKDTYLRQADPVSKVAYDSKIQVIQHALGLHRRFHASRAAASRPSTRYASAPSSATRRCPFCA